MRLTMGLLFATCLGLLTLAASSSLSAGLPGWQPQIVPTVLMSIAALIGFLVGATIASRAGRDPSRLPVFGAFTAAVGGGIVAGVTAAVMLALYLATYGSWPDDMVDRAFYVIAFPAFSTVAFFVGAFCCWFIGLLAGGLLKLSARMRA